MFYLYKDTKSKIDGSYKMSRVIIILLLFMPTATIGGKMPDFVAADFMQVTVVANNMTFNGMKMKSAEFSTKSSMEDVEKYYSDVWEEHIKKSQLQGMKILSHHDGEFLFVVQIDEKNSLAPNKTNGLLSISDPASLPKKLKLGDGFPMMATSVVINDIKSNDAAKKGRTLLFFNENGINSNLKYYRKHYTKRGWLEIEQEKKPGNPKSLFMNNGGNELNMTFSKEDGKTMIVAVMVEK